MVPSAFLWNQRPIWPVAELYLQVPPPQDPWVHLVETGFTQILNLGSVPNQGSMGPWDEFGIFTYIHVVDVYGLNVGTYTVRPMDPSWGWYQ